MFFRRTRRTALLSLWLLCVLAVGLGPASAQDPPVGNQDQPAGNQAEPAATQDESPAPLRISSTSIRSTGSPSTRPTTMPASTFNCSTSPIGKFPSRCPRPEPCSSAASAIPPSSMKSTGRRSPASSSTNSWSSPRPADSWQPNSSTRLSRFSNFSTAITPNSPAYSRSLRPTCSATHWRATLPSGSTNRSPFSRPFTT